MPTPVSKRSFGFWKVFLLLIIAGTAVLVLPVPAADKPFVTIVAQGAGSYYLGEEVVFSGMNADSDSTYLFITGSNLPENGGKLSSPSQPFISEDPGSFTIVKTKADKTWDYPWYTSGLKLDVGTYTIYAVTQPKTKEQFGDLTTYGTTSITLKKPFITAALSSPSVSKRQPFTITGTASNNPSEIQIWMIGDTYGFTTKNPVHSDCSFNFTVPAAVSENIPAGQYYLFVQHPMANDQFDIVVSDNDYVTNQINNGTKLFRITGAGHLQGSDAADALVAAFSDPGNGDDTYTEIPFMVTDAGSPTSQATAATTTPVQRQTQTAPLRYAPVGAVLLIFGIIAWKRH